MIQTVLELDLADYPNRSSFDAYEFHRHNSQQIAELPSGSYVRLRVRNYRPFIHPDASWMREDLVWQIIASDTYILEEWRTILEGAPVVQF